MSHFDDAVAMMRILLRSDMAVTEEALQKQADIVLNIPQYKDVDRVSLLDTVRSLFRITVGEFRIIERDERKKKWLDARRAQVKWDFWTRYWIFLQDEKNFAPAALKKLDQLTDRVLDSLFDPSISAEIDKRGLVVGQVQSGKTANYAGLASKAIDAGYRLVVVLAGVHNDLRSQTQSRLDEGILGFDTQYARAFNRAEGRIGTGKLPWNGIVAHSLTSSLNNGDFSKRAADSSGFNFDTQEPLIAVVKKNSAILKRLHDWLQAKAQSEEGGRISSKTLLLIDDEADHASINTRSDDAQSPTVINGWIRSILSLFRKSAYVGYTATPFANIFIPMDDDNLFPRDFIVNVPAPSNYMGPEKVFGFRMPADGETSDDVYPVVNRVADYAQFVPDKHQKDGSLPSILPESLKRAIRCFILACAIRRVRGQQVVHNSMLVHISRFVRWQNRIRDLVNDELDRYRNGVEMSDSAIVEEFRDTFENSDSKSGYLSFRSVSEHILRSSLGQEDPSVRVHEWKDVEKELWPAISRICVRAIHGNSVDSLEYVNHPQGLSVIAVGGDKLSRGLTLEGLTVSYYLRSTKMYDTLMQMGRWFGYRDGYVDLCRLFTSRELNEWFCHITKVSEELRDEFDYMADRTGATPEEYALKVRTHHGQLQISATNKIRTAVTIKVTWAGRLVELYEFRKALPARRHNFDAARAFVASLEGVPEKKGNAYVWYDIPANAITELLQSLDIHESLRAYDPGGLVRFIEAQTKVGELNAWRVALMSNMRPKSTEKFDVNRKSVPIGLFQRNGDAVNTDENTYYLRKSHLISARDELLDLNDDEYARAMQLTKARARDGVNPQYPSGKIVREEIRSPRHPLLLLYPLDPSGARLETDQQDLADDVPYIGYAISFPDSQKAEQIEYAVHGQLLDRLDWDEEAEDE